jgi:HEAT repeat protein
LRKKAQDDNPHVRAAAARALGDLGRKEAVPDLVILLRDPEGYVRSAAAQSLGKLGDRSAIQPLIGVLVGEQVPGQEGSGTGLIIGTTDQLPELARLKIVEEKIGAIRALGDLQAAEAVDPIIKYGLKSDDAGIRAEAAFGLGKIRDPRAIDPLREVVDPYYATTVPMQELEEGRMIATGPVPETMREIREKEARVRSSVAWALGQLRDQRAIPTLVKAANDVNSQVRDAAVEALAKISEYQEQQAQAQPPPQSTPTPAPAPQP